MPRWVTFSVIDRGPGIAPRGRAAAVHAVLHDPPEGMGLGLSLCRTVIEQHGGALDYERIVAPGGESGASRRPPNSASPCRSNAPQRPGRSGADTAQSGVSHDRPLPCQFIALVGRSSTAGFGLPMVYLVDDEDVVRDALAWLLRSRRLLTEGFASAEAFEAIFAERLAADRSASPTGRPRRAACCSTCACPAPAAWCCSSG